MPQAGEHQPARSLDDDATHQTMCADAPSPNRERCVSSIALSSLYRSRQVSSGKLLFVELSLPGSIAILAPEAAARELRGQCYPCALEQGDRSDGHSICKTQTA